MRTRWLTPHQEATSTTNKINWIKNDLARRLLRVQESLLEKEAPKVINQDNIKLICSGYGLKERKSIVE